MSRDSAGARGNAAIFLCDYCGIYARFNHSEGSVAAVGDVCNCDLIGEITEEQR
jgi:hypothetical protein